MISFLPCFCSGQAHGYFYFNLDGERNRVSDTIFHRSQGYTIANSLAEIGMISPEECEALKGELSAVIPPPDLSFKLGDDPRIPLPYGKIAVGEEEAAVFFSVNGGLRKLESFAPFVEPAILDQIKSEIEASGLPKSSDVDILEEVYDKMQEEREREEKDELLPYGKRLSSLLKQPAGIKLPPDAAISNELGQA